MQRDIQEILDSYVASLEANDFKERATSYHHVKKNWLRVIRTWTHDEEPAEFVIEDRKGSYQDKKDSVLVTYIALPWVQLNAMSQAVEMICPTCESEDPNTCKH